MEGGGRHARGGGREGKRSETDIGREKGEASNDGNLPSRHSGQTSETYSSRGEVGVEEKKSACLFEERGKVFAKKRGKEEGCSGGNSRKKGGRGRGGGGGGGGGGGKYSGQTSDQKFGNEGIWSNWKVKEHSQFPIIGQHSRENPGDTDDIRENSWSCAPEEGFTERKKGTSLIKKKQRKHRFPTAAQVSNINLMRTGEMQERTRMNMARQPESAWRMSRNKRKESRTRDAMTISNWAKTKTCNCSGTRSQKGRPPFDGVAGVRKRPKGKKTNTSDPRCRDGRI